ncbi:long-chain fatty acid--CoA ligase [Deinococcus detaillensis]|uniref:Long-chain fatty acid--CoA ligase n=1 Tax=Deinococcus detaillensis TaxID=2592048 RepID=A0A553V646_9DEIO|nr:long-chain fatty acid--CoA ligase [Deinococcus detaillensis]TSA87945.1 long-chain fatty acid--CoA ligase [Deinococcus detaillensis]
MKSTMMDVPLLIPEIVERARHFFAEREIVSLMVAGRGEDGQPTAKLHRTTYGEVAERALRLASAITAAGVGPGERVATLAVNSYRHLEAYLGVPSSGAVLHTLNIRLHPDQLCWIINHAEDKVLLIENLFADKIPTILENCPSIEKIVVLGPLPKPMDGVEDYDTWIMNHAPQSRYPEMLETDAAGMCYTSGTTGNPKAVTYSHRSTLLHSLASAPKDALNVGQSDAVLPIVPMFHVNAWGLPYTCSLYGAKLVFAGAFSDGPSLAKLMQDEQVTITAGVPTIWMGLLNELDRAVGAGKPYQLQLERLVVGGSAAPEAMIRAFSERHHLKLAQAWGMTETHPLGTVSITPPGMKFASDAGYALAAKQGVAVPTVQLEILDDAGNILPHDGKSMGRLITRGPWIAGSYYGGAGQENFLELGGQQWFDTGDIATLDGRGFMHIQDRAKDLIKSGGEWISSVDLENALMAHPAVSQAAVIAMPDPKWDERPLAVLVLRPDHDHPGYAELTAFLSPRFAKWWLPDAYEVVAAIPIGATGKFLKRELREQFAEKKAEGTAVR